VINVLVTATEVLVTSTSTEFPVTVTSDNSTFTVTNQVSNFTVVNQTPTISFATESAPFDFATKNRGEWVSGAVYSRGDIVYYQYSTYICDIPYDELLTSTVPPPNATDKWELFIFHEWPMAYLNVTNTATINGNLVVNGTSTFVGTTTFTDLTVNNQFIINGLKYPINKGTYGQVLYTGGDETGLAAWRNLGELVFWSLSTDLLTNGYNITSGQGATSPYTHPQLIIGAGVTGNLSSSIKFSTASSGSTGTISMTATSVSITGNFSASGNGNFRGNLLASGNLDINGSATIDGSVEIDGDTYIRGTLYGNTVIDPIKVGSGGVRFSDGTVQTTAGTGTFTVSQIASTSTLGVIKVGNHLIINSGTGVLSVYPDPGWTYSLPKATTSTLGGIKVGYGLEIDSITGILNVTSSTFTNTQATNVSLASDLITNGYSIRSGVGQPSYLNVSTASITASTTGSINIAVTSSTSYIKLTNNGATTATSISVNTGTIELKAPIIVAGTDVYNSTLQIGRIYNYAGTSAPFFPAGVQYQDNTIQRTAWRGYDQGLI
jgi:cytoskeletal protein CcmA (bactofilin family)